MYIQVRCPCLQDGQDPQDALSCRSFFTKEPLIIGIFCGQRPLRRRHPMGLRHCVLGIYIFDMYVFFRSRNSDFLVFRGKSSNQDFGLGFRRFTHTRDSHTQTNTHTHMNTPTQAHTLTHTHTHTDIHTHTHTQGSWVSRRMSFFTRYRQLRFTHTRDSIRYVCFFQIEKLRFLGISR